jgi:hypothetical protein
MRADLSARIGEKGLDLTETLSLTENPVSGIEAAQNRAPSEVASNLRARSGMILPLHEEPANLLCSPFRSEMSKSHRFDFSPYPGKRLLPILAKTGLVGRSGAVGCTGPENRRAGPIPLKKETVLRNRLSKLATPDGTSIFRRLGD